MATSDHPVIRRLRRAAATAPIIVGHRGASDAFPENTLPAFAAALDEGALVIELDIRATADGELVCIHDATLDRTTDAAVRAGRAGIEVAATPAAEVLALDAGAWRGEAHAGIRVPTLQAALELIQARGITMIEHKAGDPAALVALLRRTGLVEAVLVQSFDWDFVAAVRALEPRIALGVLGEGRLTEAQRRRAAELGAGLVHWNVRDLRVEDVADLHDDGFLVCVYTANSDAALIGCIAMGIDAITTNHPDRLREMIAVRDGG